MGLRVEDANRDLSEYEPLLSMVVDLSKKAKLSYTDLPFVIDFLDKLYDDKNKKIAELEHRLVGCIEPKFVEGQKIYVVGTEDIEEVEYFGENIDGIITFEEGCRCGCTPDRYSVEKRENVFATEEEAKAKMKKIKGE